MLTDPSSLSALALTRWKHQHLASESPEIWLEGYRASGKLPSRSVVLEGLAWCQPWESLVELGCNAGPMLSLIRETWPQAGLIGIEPNPVAGQRAREILGEDIQITETSLQEWLESEHSPDVIVTHYTLAYLPPEEIRPVLAQMCRSARRGLVLAEPMGQEQLIWTYPEWSHDYVGHLISLDKTDIVFQEITGVGNLNGVLACRW